MSKQRTRDRTPCKSRLALEAANGIKTMSTGMVVPGADGLCIFRYNLFRESCRSRQGEEPVCRATRGQKVNAVPIRERLRRRSWRKAAIATAEKVRWKFLSELCYGGLDLG